MSNEKKEKFLQKHKMSVFVILSTLLMLIGLSYAWLQLTLRGSKELTMIAAGILYLELDESMSGGIGVENAVPVTDDVGKSQEGYTFTLENKGKIRSDYTIYLDDLELDSEKTRMSDAVIKYQLTRDEEEIGFSLLNSTGTHPSRVLESGSIAPGEKYTYVLKMWIDFNIAPSNTNGKGVYTLAETKPKKYPVHYYRGAVEDNNVKFAGFCWKIVRTTETGGIKMIYNGTPDSAGRCMNKTGEATEIGTSAFNSVGSSAADVGYMVGERYEYGEKNIESLSENWKYGNDVEWDGNQYILKDTIESNTANWSNDYKQVAKKYHYTCFNNAGVCTEVGYIHRFFTGGGWGIVFYLPFNNGKKLEDMKREMFANETDSTIKQVVDEWYQKNMIPYTEKVRGYHMV